MGLVLVFKGGREFGQRRVFNTPAVKVGSSPTAHLVLKDDPQVEPEHFMIEVVGPGSYQIRDLRTRRGTYVNGKRITAAPLSDEDVIRAGLTVFQFFCSTDVSDAAPGSAAPPTEVARLSPEVAGGPTVQAVLVAGALDEALEPLSPTYAAADTQTVVGDTARDEDDPDLRAALAAATKAQGYELGRPLGHGSFGRVYQATRVADGTPVAVKVFDGVPADSPKRLKLFLREIDVHKTLDHPHIVRLLSTGGLEEKIAWFVMEYVDGCHLGELVHSAGGRLGVADTCSIVGQILSALEYAHSFPAPDGPFVHRDVKLSNILVSGTPGKYHAKLADYGIAKNYAFAGWSGMTVTGKACGTLEFMPPEQAVDSKYVGPEVDIYAMGGVLYYCLSGRIMYDIAAEAQPTELLHAVLARRIVPLRRRCPGVPESLDRVLDRAVGRDAVRRYRTAKQMARAIEDALATCGSDEAPGDVG